MKYLLFNHSISSLGGTSPFSFQTSPDRYMRSLFEFIPSLWCVSLYCWRWYFAELTMLWGYGGLLISGTTSLTYSNLELQPRTEDPRLKPNPLIHCQNVGRCDVVIGLLVLAGLRFPFPRNSRAMAKNFTSRGIPAGFPRVFRVISVPWS